MYLETNLLKIKQIASVKNDENFRFRSYLKSKDSDKIDSIVHQLHDELIKQIDCYESRPIQCRKFPYTDQEDFISRLWGMIGFYEICPIVFNLMEELKDKMHFYRKRKF